MVGSVEELLPRYDRKHRSTANILLTFVPTDIPRGVYITSCIDKPEDRLVLLEEFSAIVVSANQSQS
jgi:hypothetical protein